MSDQTFETGDRNVTAKWWLVALLAVPSVAAAGEPPAGPLSLGQETGGVGGVTVRRAPAWPSSRSF